MDIRANSFTFFSFLQGVYLPFIPLAFWFVRFNVQRKMADIEEENVPQTCGIAGTTSRLSDEESGYFSPQKVDKINRHGYIIPLTVCTDSIYPILYIGKFNFIALNFKPRIVSGNLAVAVAVTVTAEIIGTTINVVFIL